MKTKRLLSVMLTLALVLSLFSGAFTVTAEADDGTWTLIGNKTELAAINSDSSGKYRLTADIDLVGIKWTPIAAFSGELDGGGHVISNLSITDTTTAGKGLFASIASSGKVYDLGIKGANITAGDTAGILAGSNGGTISRCYTKGTISGDEHVGGIAGKNEAGGKIENCYSQAAVNGTNYLGGLAGSNSGTIEKSYTASTVKDSVLNNYLEFDGGGYISIPHNNEYTGNAFTLEAWFQWEGIDTNNINFIIGKGYERFEIHTGGAAGKNGLRFIPIPSASNKDYAPSGYEGDSYIDVHNVLQTGWFHVAAVYWYESGNAYAKVYVNGEEQELWQGYVPTAGHAGQSAGKTATISRTSNPLAANGYTINIGRRTNNSYFFDGKIADVRFWNTSRSAIQIKDNKDKVLTGTEAGLVGYWKLNDDLGDDVTEGEQVDDATTYDNNGTIHGSVTQTKVSTATNKGPLVGSGTVTNCFYDKDVYGAVGDATGAKTTAEMKIQATYTNWNFTEIWRIATGEYPSFWGREATPAATFTATGDSTGTLSGVEDGMKYSTGGSAWTAITDTSVNLTGISSCTISVMKPGDGTTTLDSDMQTITVTKAAAPTTVSKTDCTTSSNNDGTLTGVTTGMEYMKSTDSTWTDGTGSTITDLTNGTYYVRVKASGTALASESQSITIAKKSGGGSTPKTPVVPPEAPAAPVIVDGKTENIGRAETTSTETKVSVDSGKLAEKVQDAQEGGSVLVAVDDGKDAATAQLVVENVEEMAKKDMTLTVQTGGVSYEVPTTAIDTAAIMQELGATNPADVPINLTITKSDSNGEAQVSSAVQVEGASLVLPPVSFSVTATYGGKTVEVKRFDSFVPREVEVNEEQAKRITTAIIREDDGSIRHVPTFVYEKDGKWYARINSRTNSVYAFISNDKSFADAAGKWFEAAVNEMAGRKIVNGKSEDAFAGEDSITRAEFATILIRALGLPEGGTAEFTD